MKFKGGWKNTTFSIYDKSGMMSLTEKQAPHTPFKKLYLKSKKIIKVVYP